MSIRLIQPEGWAPAKGYANGIAARGTQIFVGGQIGWNAQQQFETDDFIEQVHQTLRNVAETGPWFHDGHATTLEEAVRTMAAVQLGRDLDAAQVQRIVAFLRSMTGTLPAYAALPPST